MVTLQDRSLVLVERHSGRTPDEVRAHHPEFENLPTELIPWPYRDSDWPMATHCPRCGRRLKQFSWHLGNGVGEYGYLEGVCFGSWQRFIPAGFTTQGLSHFQISLGQVYKGRVRLTYDPKTGQSMDGPAHREQQQEKKS